MSKKSPVKKKVAKKNPTADSESQQIVNEDASISEVIEDLLPLDAIEATYPKLGTYRNESSPYGNPSAKRRIVKPSAMFKPTSVRRLMSLTAEQKPS